MVDDEAHGAAICAVVEDVNDGAMEIFVGNQGLGNEDRAGSGVGLRNVDGYYFGIDKLHSTNLANMLVKSSIFGA